MRSARWGLAVAAGLLALGGGQAATVGGDAPRWVTTRRASRPVAVAPTSIRAARPTLVLWRHQYETDLRHAGPDPTLPNSAGKLLELVETGDDGAPVARRWWRYAYPYDEVFPRALRSEAIGWDAAGTKLWVFACTSREAGAHIDAFEVEAPTSTGEPLARAPDRLESWPASPAPRSRHVLRRPDVPREWQTDQVHAVLDGTGFTIALSGPHTDAVRWLRFEPDGGWSELPSGPRPTASPGK